MIAGSATFTTVESTNTIVDPRMQATRVRRLRIPSLRSPILFPLVPLAQRAKEKRCPATRSRRLEDVPDVLGDYPGEMRMLTTDLGTEQVAFTYRRMPQHTGGKGSYGHCHKTPGGGLLRRLAAGSSSSSATR